MFTRSAHETVIIENISNEDIDSIIQLGTDVPQFDTGTNSLKFFSEETLERMVKSDNCVLLAAKRSGEIIGFIITSINIDTRDAYIHTILVIEQVRNQGIGGMLLDKTLTKLRETPEKCNHVFGLVHPDNLASLHLLARLGFDSGTVFKYNDMMLLSE